LPIILSLILHFPQILLLNVVRILFNFEQVNVLDLHLFSLLLIQELIVHLLVYIIPPHIEYLVCVSAHLSVKPYEVRLISVAASVGEDEVVHGEERLVEVVVAVLDEGQEEVETHGFGQVVEGLAALHIVVQTVDSKDAGLLGEHVEVCEELNQAFIVLNVLQLDLSESVDGDLAVDPKDHL
jgi:hypothetical protein